MTTEDNKIDDTDFDLTRKKKSKKRINHPETIPIPTPTDSIAEGGTTEDGDFSYEFLVNRVFDKIREVQGPPQVFQIILPPVRVARIGTRRTSFINFGATCKVLKRQEKTLYDYFVVELGTTASIDANHALIIRGRLTPRQIENVLCSFIKEYVSCKTCRSPDTLLKKEDRLMVIICHTCHSQYTVSNIRTGFQAQIGKRQKPS